MEKWRGLFFVIGVAAILISILTPEPTLLRTVAFWTGAIAAGQNWPFD